MTHPLIFAQIYKPLFLKTLTHEIVYHTYDYKIFPDENNFDFIVELPFNGLGVAVGGVVQMTIIMPLNSTINQEITEGVTINGEKIEEFITVIPEINRNIVSFRYQNDPKFTIRYHY